MRRRPVTESDRELAWEVWRQTVKDIAQGRAGEPVPSNTLDLQEILLVDSLGIWEQHGAAAVPKARTIRHFRRNRANDYAWMPQRLRHDSFPHLLAAVQLMTEFSSAVRPRPGVLLGKADF